MKRSIETVKRVREARGGPSPVLLPWLLAAALALGCTVPLERPAPRPQIRALPSGFLGSYEGFHRSTTGSLVYRKRGADLSQYRTFLLEPVDFYAGAEDLSKEDRAHLAQYFRRALLDATSDRYAFVDAPGPRVLRIRAALTGVRGTQSTPVDSELPPSDLYGDTGGTVERRLGFAAVEAELLDSRSEERLFAVVARRDAELALEARSLTRWGHIEAIIDRWALSFREQLDAWQRASAPTGPFPQN